MRFLEAELCYQADSYETGPRFAKVLADLSADDNDPYVRAVCQLAGRSRSLPAKRRRRTQTLRPARREKRPVGQDSHEPAAVLLQVDGFVTYD